MIQIGHLATEINAMRATTIATTIATENVIATTIVTEPATVIQTSAPVIKAVHQGDTGLTMAVQAIVSFEKVNRIVVTLVMLVVGETVEVPRHCGPQ